MGASQTKQKSVLEQVTDIVNQTVNQSSTSIKASAKADQNMEISCSDKQMEIARVNKNKYDVKSPDKKKK